MRHIRGVRGDRWFFTCSFVSWKCLHVTNLRILPYHGLPNHPKLRAKCLSVWGDLGFWKRRKCLICPSFRRSINIVARPGTGELFGYNLRLTTTRKTANYNNAGRKMKSETENNISSPINLWRRSLWPPRRLEFADNEKRKCPIQLQEELDTETYTTTQSNLLRGWIKYKR